MFTVSSYIVHRDVYYTDTVMCRCHLECQKEVCKQVITRLVRLQKTQCRGTVQFIEDSRLYVELKVSEF